jgi:hypothetical protein
MFNSKQFEAKVYKMVTKEVNKAFVELLKRDDGIYQEEGIQLQRKIMDALQYITAEVTSQVLYGLLLNKRRD